MVTIANPSVNPSGSTIYDLFVTDNNGCEQADQATVIVFSADAGDNTSVCDGLGTVIGGDALQGVPIVPLGTPISGQYGVAYDWTPVSNLSCSDCPNPIATPNEMTEYTLTTTLYQPDGSLCQTQDVVTVDVIEAPSGDLAISDRVLCLGDEIELGSLLPSQTISISSLTQSTTGSSMATIANLTDGNYSTGGHTKDGSGQNIKVDLGSIHTITQLQIAAKSGNAGDDRLYIEVSTDNSSFTQIAYYANGVAANQLTTIDFDPVSARYIRFRSGANGRDVSLSEVYVLYDYNYIWTPGIYINADGKSAIYDAGNLEMPSICLLYTSPSPRDA